MNSLELAILIGAVLAIGMACSDESPTPQSTSASQTLAPGTEGISVSPSELEPVRSTLPDEFDWPGPGIFAFGWIVEAGLDGPVAISGVQGEDGTVALFSRYQDDGEEPQSSLVLSPPFSGDAILGYVRLAVPGVWLFEISTPAGAFEIALHALGQPIPEECRVSDSVDVRDDIAPGLSTGEGIWMISPQRQVWLGPDFPYKTVWVADLRYEEAIQIAGRLVDGATAANFSNYDGSVERRETLTLAPPHDIGIDNRGYVYYPEPGCWVFDIEAAGATYSIATYLAAP